MLHIDGFDIDAIPTWSVLFAFTTPEEYEMERLVIAERYEGEWQKYVVAQGGHCSCYEFDAVKWDAWIVDQEELVSMANGWLTGNDLERAAASFLAAYFGQRKWDEITEWNQAEAAAKRREEE